MVLGGEINVETLEGTQKIKVPAGTQNGHVFKLKGEGVPTLNNPKKRGDCFIQVQVHVPGQVNSETRRLLEKLAALEDAEKQKHLAGSGAGSLFGKFKEALSG
jgi:molecular chaperone DnaJ